ncbi:SusC/RagA family TonB-linked outer membrane protein [Paraflavitalea soli]|nr:SusC/RagA family TonB-linked outer membrane protein [Paraflavitalea soli]
MLTLFLLSSGVLLAQKSVSGKITDNTGAPVISASITVKGTNTGTTSKTDGSFSLTVPQNAKILVVSAIGMESKEVSITSAAILSVVLNAEDKIMEDIVVVAYGTQKKGSITGSIAKIGAEQLETRLTTNITQALAGAAPGIATTSGNGQPGSSAAIRIRGFGSVNASNDPLFVVDGFPYEGYIGDLNTNDIESVTLLKDASSTALYGARAANGVVMVTTKRGKMGAPKVNLSYTSGFSQRGIPEYDRVGTNDYYPLMWQALKNSLMYPLSGTGGLSESAAATQASNTIAAQLVYNPYNVPANQIVGTDGKLNPNAQLLYNDFDWFDGIINNGSRNEVSLNVSSKSDKSDYYISLNYVKDGGFIMKSDYERATARVVLNSQAKSWLKVGLNLSGVMVKANNASATTDNASSIINPFVFARGIGPIYPVHAYDASGALIYDAKGNPMYDYGLHPGAVNRPQSAYPGRHVIYETELNTNQSTRNSIIARTYLEGKFAKYFTFTTNVGLDLNNTRGKTFQNKIVGDGVTGGGTSSRSANEYRTISMNQLLNYGQTFGPHEVKVLLGHENQWVDENTFSGNRRGMNLDGNVELINFVTLGGVSGQYDRLRRDAYLSRASYSYDQKYYLDLSYRRDASSRFSPDSRWGNFYSVGASWFLTREDFLKTATWLNELKLRAAYGTVGNDGLSTYYEYQPLYDLGWNNAAEPGALASKLANPDLTWEVNKTFTVGIDFGVLQNRITGSVEVFNRGSSDLLFDVPQGLSSMVTTRTENIGSMSNKGIEAQINASIIRSKDVKWDLTVNFTSLKNEITKLPNGQAITSGTKRLEQGKDLYAFYLRQWYGVDPADGAGLYYKLPTATTDIRVIKGDSFTTNPSNARYDYSGSAIPKFFGSLTNTVSYKNFTFSFLLNYQVGGKFYDGNYVGYMTAGYGKSLSTDLLKSWQKPGDISDIPRFDITGSTNFNAQSNRFLIDASYLAVRNATFSYAFSKGLLSKIKCDQLKFYISGENLFVFSKRKGLNPMENFNGTNSAVYVPNRLLSAGINVTF